MVGWVGLGWVGVRWSYRFSYSKYVFICILLAALSSLFAVRCQYNFV